MEKSPSAYFLPIIVALLLVLYTGTITFMIYCAFAGTGPCDTCGNTREFGLVATTVGGLVSALAIAELSISVPGRGMTSFLFSNLDKRKVGLTWAYLIIWMTVGLAALVVGTLIQPEPDPIEVTETESKPSDESRTAVADDSPNPPAADQEVKNDHDVNQTLSDIGMAWLGLAVAAGLAYFALTPPNYTRRREDG